MAEYQRVSAAEAQAGDEVYKAGKWCLVADVKVARISGGNVWVKYLHGGTDSAPAHHFTFRRQIADGPTQVGGT